MMKILMSIRYLLLGILIMLIFQFVVVLIMRIALYKDIESIVHFKKKHYIYTSN